MASLNASRLGPMLRPALRLLPDSLFGRLALLLVVVAVSSHLLAITLMFELRPLPPPPLGVLAMGPRPPRPPHPPPWSLPLLLDIGVRLGALVLAAWLGARWIAQPVRKLVDNAARYGQCTRIGLLVQPHGLRVQVLDHGPGMAADELSKVVAPFYRVDKSRSRSHGGVGLGLAIADEIARRHRGELQLANAPQGGLLATLVLPL